MERLTEKIDELNKLEEYKNLEEDGLLIKVPCKVGDRVWVNANKKAVECEVLWIEIHRNGVLSFALDGGFGVVLLAHLGKKWFLSKEEAEKATKGA